MKLVRHGPHITTEDREMTVPRRSGGTGSRERMLEEEEHIKNRKAAMRRKIKQQAEVNHGQIIPGAAGEADSERTDVITQKPLNFHAEERTRRKETDKWLDRHFGSEWSLSQRSSNPSNPNEMAHSRSRFYRHHQSNEQSNVENNACEDFNAKVRRAQSFNCIPVSYNNPVSRVIKHTTTTYRPGMEGKTVYSSVTKNVVSPPDPKIRAYHSTSNLNSRNTPAPSDNRQLNSNYESHFTSFPGIANHQPTMKSHSTSLLNGIVKEHSPMLGKKDTSVVREIPIITTNKSHASILEKELGQNQPNRPPRKIKGANTGTNTFMKSTGDLYGMNGSMDQNYYKNRGSYYFGTSADNLPTGHSYNTSNSHGLGQSIIENQNYFPGRDKRKSRKDQLITESTPLKSYERVQSAPDPERQYHGTSNIFAGTQGGESITTGFESTAGLLGVTYQGNDYHLQTHLGRPRPQDDVNNETRQIPIREEVYHDSPRPERKSKRLVPTVEGINGSKKENDRLVYRSESTRKPTR